MQHPSVNALAVLLAASVVLCPTAAQAETVTKHDRRVTSPPGRATSLRDGMPLTTSCSSQCRSGA
jgi:hypothetical protein